MTHVARAVAVLCLGLFASSSAHAWTRGHASRFGTLPPGSGLPEGIAIDAAGDVFVSTFDPTGASPGQVAVFDRSGRLLRVLDVAGASPLLLGLGFHEVGDAVELLVVDFGARDVLRVDPETGASSVFSSIPGAAGPNALAFDGAGNVYVSDSFQGVIWQTGPAGGAPTAWAESPLLSTSGVPPFGANGLAFDAAETTLFVANTGDDTVVKIPTATRTAEVFVNGINGADGLAVDPDGNVWVVANQADEIVVVDPIDGHAIAKLGDFDGISRDGAAVGLLFPASLALRGEFVYVTNLALDLRLFGPAFDAVDSAWTAQVTRHTVARLPRRLPPVRGE
jgi:sugar lactone lactonase YvrE